MYIYIDIHVYVYISEGLCAALGPDQGLDLRPGVGIVGVAQDLAQGTLESE